METRDTDEPMFGKDLEDTWRNDPKTFVDGDIEDMYGIELSDDERRLIRDTANKLHKLDTCSVGDRLTVVGSNGDWEVTGEIEEIGDRWWFLVGEESENVEIVIDFEGAHTSLVRIYVPYINMRVDDISAGDVVDIVRGG